MALDAIRERPLPAALLACLVAAMLIFGYLLPYHGRLRRLEMRLEELERWYEERVAELERMIPRYALEVWASHNATPVYVSGDCVLVLSSMVFVRRLGAIPFRPLEVRIDVSVGHETNNANASVRYTYKPSYSFVVESPTLDYVEIPFSAWPVILERLKEGDHVVFHAVIAISCSHAGVRLAYEIVRLVFPVLVGSP